MLKRGCLDILHFFPSTWLRLRIFSVFVIEEILMVNEKLLFRVSSIGFWPVRFLMLLMISYGLIVRTGESSNSMRRYRGFLSSFGFVFLLFFALFVLELLFAVWAGELSTFRIDRITGSLDSFSFIRSSIWDLKDSEQCYWSSLKFMITLKMITM